MYRATVEPIDELLSTSHLVRARADVFRGGVFLGSAPVTGGELSETADQFVSGTLDLDVATVSADGVSWVPEQPLDSLNVYGQRIYLSYDVGRASGEWLSTGLGWFIVDEWEHVGDTVSVSALDVRDALRTARLLAPASPTGTFVSELRRLVGGRLPLNTSSAPADRSVSGGMAWEESRTDAIDELLTAWPARVELDGDGVLVVLPATLDEQPADCVLVEGVGGTVVKRTSSGSRDDLANVVVARGDVPDDPTSTPIVGYAADTNVDSPTYAAGPMGELVKFFSSPLLTTKAQADAAAATILKRSLRAVESIPVTILPDPRIGVNTRIDLTLSTGTVKRCTVLSSKLPLTGEGGAQQLRLGVIRDA